VSARRAWTSTRRPVSASSGDCRRRLERLERAARQLGQGHVLPQRTPDAAPARGAQQPLGRGVDREHAGLAVEQQRRLGRAATTACRAARTSMFS
jgi:hypothetical protein